MSDERPTDRAWWVDVGGSHTTRLMLLGLAKHANNTTLKCWPSIKTLRKETHLGDSTIRAQIQILENLELEDGKPVLTVDRLNGAGNRYTLHLPESAPGDSAVPDESAPGDSAVEEEDRARSQRDRASSEREPRQEVAPNYLGTAQVTAQIDEAAATAPGDSAVPPVDTLLRGIKRRITANPDQFDPLYEVLLEDYDTKAIKTALAVLKADYFTCKWASDMNEALRDAMFTSRSSPLTAEDWDFIDDASEGAPTVLRAVL